MFHQHNFYIMLLFFSGRAFESLSTIIFLLMLILMGKGYTITRGKLSAISTIKITVFFTLYTIAYIVMFIWEGIVSMSFSNTEYYILEDFENLSFRFNRLIQKH